MKVVLALLVISLGLVSANVANRVPVDQQDHVKNGQKNYLLKNNRVPKLPAPERPEQPQVNLMDTCADCKAIVQRIDTIIDDESKIQRVKFMLGLICDLLSEESKNECKNMVNNLDTLIHELRPLLKDPEAFCRQLHLCGTGNTNRVVKFLLLLVKKQVNKIANPSFRNDILCDECKFAVSEAKQMWDQQSIQDEVKQILDSLCNYLGQYKDECDNLVDTYFPLLVSEVDQLLSDPLKTCTDLGLCNTKTLTIAGHQLFPARMGSLLLHHTKKSELQNFIKRLGRIQTRAGYNTGCTVCVYSVTALIDTLKADPQLLQSWASGIQKICNSFPADLQPGCNDFLGIYLEPVLVVALDSVTPREVCDLLHACTGQKFDHSMMVRGQVKNAIVCESCRLIAEFMKSEFQQKEFQDEITTELKTICDFIPGQYANQCDAYIDDFVPYVMQLIVTALDPNTACPELNLCPQQQTRVQEVANENEA